MMYLLIFIVKCSAFCRRQDMAMAYTTSHRNVCAHMTPTDSGVERNATSKQQQTSLFVWTLRALETEKILTFNGDLILRSSFSVCVYRKLCKFMCRMAT